MSVKALLIVNERLPSLHWRRACADSGSAECQLVEAERLEGTLQNLKERPDIILVDPDQPMERLVRTVVRARERAPDVPLLVLPDARSEHRAREILRHVATLRALPDRRNGNPVAWAMRCSERPDELEGRLLHLALRDDLTGLYNRRGFSLIAEEYHRTACRMRQNLLMFFADLDGLKRINDRFGHHEGDRALVRAAASLRKTFRGSEVVARLGGDEFIALVVERGGRDARTICRRLQHSVAAWVEVETRYRLTLSVGYARFSPTQALSLQELLKQADEALYRQKRSATRTPAQADVPDQVASQDDEQRALDERSHDGAESAEAVMGC